MVQSSRPEEDWSTRAIMVGVNNIVSYHVEVNSSEPSIMVGVHEQQSNSCILTLSAHNRFRESFV